MAKSRRERKRGPFIDGDGYPQQHPNRTDHLWGWDDEGVLYEPSPAITLPGGDKAILIQEHPELMHRILNLCQEFAVGLAAKAEGKEAAEAKEIKEAEQEQW